jgi:nicotinamidase-related amidase
MGELPLPAFHAPEQARTWGYRPDEAALFAAARAWRAEHDLRPAARDERRVHLLLIDAQRDFCFPEGSLYVGGRSGTGALDDSVRMVEFIYRNLGRLSEITCTLDSHLPFQIFSSSFWQDEHGAALGAHREITLDDVRSGRARPNPDVAAFVSGGDVAWLQRQVEFYCAELERHGRYTLYLWPPHCLLGSEGHLLVGAVQAARLFHAWARSAPNEIEIKGRHALTENYSVLAPEVLAGHDGTRLAARNTGLVERLLGADALVVAGQAASHCVKSTLDGLLTEIQARDARLARKVYVLHDAMSAVAVPDPQRPGAFLADFTPQAEATLARLAEAGMHLVSTRTPMEAWPGVTRRRK